MNNGKNVIWFIADQMRAQALSCNGDPNINTPNIDLLAAQGVNFEHAVSGCPLCAPFRGCLLTGQYVHKSTVPEHDYSLDPAMPVITDVFRREGYDTLYFGKWHLDGDTPRKGTGLDPKTQIVAKDRRARFDTWIGYENNNSQSDVWVHGHDQEREIPLTRLREFETDALTDMAIEKIRRYGERKKAGEEKPFFMVVSVQPPHDPYTAPAESMSHYHPAHLTMRPNVPPYKKIRETAGRELAGYYALIENIDDNLGRMRQALREAQLDLNTHILFFSDHGDMHGSHGMFRKTNPYEESVRIPFIIGGEVPMGYYGRGCRRTDSVISHVDIAPTTFGLCGIDQPDWMPGFDYSYERVPYLRKPAGPVPEEAYLQSVIPTRHDHSIDRAWRGIVTRDGYKYVCFENQEWLMFDLNEDPYEMINLAHLPLAAEKRTELNERLRSWVKRTEDDFTVPTPEYTTFPTEYVTYPGTEDKKA